MGDPDAGRQRLDKWLWHARMARTRTAAAALVSDGHVRVNGQRVEQPARPVRTGDVLTIALERDVRLIRVAGFAERRGPFETARRLYEDLAAPQARDPACDPPRDP